MPTTIIPYDKALPEVPGRNPYTRPDAYLEKLGEGRYKVQPGRRPSGMFLVEKLRVAVDSWRDTGYPGLSPASRRLFQYWFEEDHLLGQAVFRYYWAQREAMETLAYLVEARPFDDFKPLAEAFGDVPKHGLFPIPFSIQTTMDGVRLLRRWAPEAEKEASVELPQENLLRYAFKMATGAGKTIVIAMAMVWSYYNRLFGRHQQTSEVLETSEVSTSKIPFANNFLIVAPNVIVFERLERDFASNKIFYELPLIPPEWRGRWQLKVILRGDSAAPDPGGNLFLVNIQQIHLSREREAAPLNPVEAILGRQPKQNLADYQPSLLERLKSLPNLLALNDEAHHVHDDDLAWNQTLLALHDNLQQKTSEVLETSEVSAKQGRGFFLWLDFSATPKTQAGTYYPLAQAIEDRVVKAPLIVHQVNKKDPDKVTKDNIIQVYHDWIAVALARWREHTRFYQQLGQKPVLFIMAERTAYADVIAEHIRKQARLKKSEVLVIHTDAQGNITQKSLDEARQAAREVDRPASPVKIIVSVLMLREGWDVKNVTIILGLRPFTAKANILPEQSVGRGLRLMLNLGPDRQQTLEVIGTEAFETFVRELEQEGVGIDTVGPNPPMPMMIYPVQEKIKYDIAIPLTKPQYRHEYRNLGQLDPLALAPIFKADVLDEIEAIEIEMAFATTGTTVHQALITPDQPLLSQDFLRDISQRIEQNLNLNGRFAQLYPIVKTYLRRRCFGLEVDLESDDIKRRLRDPHLQQGIVAYLSRQIAQLATQERGIEFEDVAFRLSQTLPFKWSRPRLDCEKTIFFKCAVYNDLEARFAQFLDEAEDILRFAALAESYTRFRVDYLSQSGAIKFYYPDFVAVQTTLQGEVNWIIETKGREDENVAHKDAAIEEWGQKISAQTGQSWRYLKAPQREFDEFKGELFAELIQKLGKKPAQTQLM